MNKVLLYGNVGETPKIKDFDNGGKVAQFSFATTRIGFKTKDGKEVEAKTSWHNIVVRRTGLAKVVEQYVKKGTPLFIEGELTYRKYADSNNVERIIAEVEVSDIRLLGGAGNKNNEPAPAPTPSDDLPF